MHELCGASAPMSDNFHLSDILLLKTPLLLSSGTAWRGR